MTEANKTQRARERAQSNIFGIAENCDIVRAKAALNGNCFEIMFDFDYVFFLVQSSVSALFGIYAMAASQIDEKFAQWIRT